MSEHMQGFTPDDLQAVFAKLYAAAWDAILIGGQAVNVWAVHYERDLPAWRDMRPYTSRDLDYHGGLAEARRAMQILGARGRLNTGMEPSPNAGLLTVALPGGQTLLVDILTGVFGLSSAEVERTAVRLVGTGALSGLVIRVIHPLLLMEGKAAALHGLPQSDRQDAKHLRILILVLQAWLSEQLETPRAVFRSIERLTACALSPDGLHAYSIGIELSLRRSSNSAGHNSSGDSTRSESDTWMRSETPITKPAVALRDDCQSEPASRRDAGNLALRSSPPSGQLSARSTPGRAIRSISRQSLSKDGERLRQSLRSMAAENLG